MPSKATREKIPRLSCQQPRCRLSPKDRFALPHGTSASTPQEVGMILSLS